MHDCKMVLTTLQRTVITPLECKRTTQNDSTVTWAEM